MKVLLVNSEKGMRGGEHQTAALGLGLKRKGCEVRLAVPPGAPIIDRISGFLPFVTFRFETLPFGTPASLSRLIATWKPDILHAQTSRAHTHLWIARLFLKDAPPLVVSRRVAFGVSGCVSGRFKYRMGV
ncbi:MAG: glycosyltransferase, partial [Candidatus Krumholzibacteria bacterium]|nr:glycosyltransferase [Candidatus Krumholzibacteria bacterium]